MKLIGWSPKAGSATRTLMGFRDCFDFFDSMQRVDILVCQADSCKRAAAEAVQLEIEELAKSVRGCQLRVLATGCLGACSEAPNALILKSGREVLHSRLTEVERSVRLVGQATGQQIHCEDPVVVQRLTEARKMRLRMEASKSRKWNAALCGMEAFINSTSGRQRVQLQLEYAKLLESAAWRQLIQRVSLLRCRNVFFFACWDFQNRGGELGGYKFASTSYRPDKQITLNQPGSLATFLKS